MQLITNETRKQLEANYLETQAAETSERNFDPRPVVKLFNPVGSQTWLLTEIEPGSNNAFGLCDMGQGYPELGYVSIDELAKLKLYFDMKIERDIHFEAHMTISEYADRARETGSIAA
tara:strand:- start:595 stop:948 length:354 start_codon:yes stop_codon:yes gene_type:complete